MPVKLMLALLLVATCAAAQAPPQMISVDDAIERALRSSSLPDHGTPFHALMAISKPGDPNSPFQGTIEVFWLAPTTYRTIVTSATFSQTRIVNGDQVEERNTGDFYPSWLHSYLQVLMSPLPRPELFQHRSGNIALGEPMRSCIRRDDRPGGITDQMTWGDLCFQGAEPRFESVMDFTSFKEFGDYRAFGKKVIAMRYQDYLDGNDPVVGQLTTLEPLTSPDPALFTIAHPTPADALIASQLVSTAKEESLRERGDDSPWPSIREGKSEGYMIVHAITDRTGQVREAYKHNSDNPGLEAAGVARALHYKFKPLIVDGVPRQMEMPLVLHFSSHVEDPLPVLTGEDILKVATGCGTPSLRAGLLPTGTVFHIKISVNETGEVTGETFPEANTMNVPSELLSQARRSLQSCQFMPYVRNGVPTYYHANFAFTVP